MNCLKTGCSTPRHHPDSDQQTSPFCANHWYSCRILDCPEQSNFAAGTPYCRAHGCQNPGCSQPMSDGRTACAYHTCRITTTTCNEFGADYSQGRYYCITHTCNASGCLWPTHNRGETSDQTFALCLHHRCAAQGCPHPHRESSDLCHNHARCTKSGCSAIKNINDRFCPDHNNTCIHLSCPNTRKEYGHWDWFDPGVFRSWRQYFVRDGFREHCANHECEAPDCSDIQEYAQGRRYCHQHAAPSSKYSTDQDNLVITTTCGMNQAFSK